MLYMVVLDHTEGASAIQSCAEKTPYQRTLTLRARQGLQDN